jgi:hypothetical protein
MKKPIKIPAPKAALKTVDKIGLKAAKKPAKLSAAARKKASRLAAGARMDAEIAAHNAWLPHFEAMVMRAYDGEICIGDVERK